ncbi:MAG: 50S ribosomal protein L13 [Candidatus Moranbacteria bacterium]|nr:50S ribosomal protein L13 [Candidatus Moranbacteria bacterium]
MAKNKSKAEKNNQGKERKSKIKSKIDPATKVKGKQAVVKSKTLKKKTRKKVVARKTIKFDLKDQVFGRAASEVALLLSGKRKIEYEPHKDLGDFVMAYNLNKVQFKGNNKLQDKIYYRHSWYPGGIKETTLSKAIDKDFEKVFTQAVYRMLPKNKLRKQMIKRLKLKRKEV